MVKCDKYSSRVCNPCARKIRNLGSLYSFVQESIQDKISKSTPTKSTAVKKRLLDTPEGKSPIRKSVRVLSPATKTNNGKSSRKALEFGQERLETSEKENSDNLDQYLNIDNLPEGGLQVKVVYKSNSGNVIVRSQRDEKTKSLVRQICDKNWHAAANTITNHSELYAEVLKTVNKNASNEMSEYLKSESMLLCNKPDEITGFSNSVFLEELRIFCPVLYYRPHEGDEEMLISDEENDTENSPPPSQPRPTLNLQSPPKGHRENRPPTSYKPSSPPKPILPKRQTTVRTRAMKKC